VETRRAIPFSFSKIDIADPVALPALFREVRPVRVVNLAAQAARPLFPDEPSRLLDSSLVGFVNILERRVRHNRGGASEFTASSSSVYGANTKNAVLGA